jgi:hypothetical protein
MIVHCKFNQHAFLHSVRGLKALVTLVNGMHVTMAQHTDAPFQFEQLTAY